MKVKHVLALVVLFAAGAFASVALTAGEQVFSFTFTDASRTATVPSRTHTVTVNGKPKTVTDAARTYTFPGQTHSVTTTVAGSTATSTIATTTTGGAEPTPIAGQGYSLAFSDEFNAALDPAVWTTKQ